MRILEPLSDRQGGFIPSLIRATIRLLQFVLALTVAGLYGQDLHRAHKAGAYTDSKWVYAEVVAGLSAVTVIAYTVTFALFNSFWFFAWDWVMFILWTALFGTFGKIYIPAHPTPEQHGQQRMKSAVWVDLVNMLLWFITAVWGTVMFFFFRQRKTLHTGRANV